MSLGRILRQLLVCIAMSLALTIVANPAVGSGPGGGGGGLPGGGGGGGGGGAGGGGGGGGGGATAINLLTKHVWVAQLGNAVTLTTYNSNGQFVMNITDFAGNPITSISGSYTFQPNTAPNTVATEGLFTLTSQGQTLLFGEAVFNSPGSILFNTSFQAIPGSGLSSNLPEQFFMLMGG